MIDNNKYLSTETHVVITGGGQGIGAAIADKLNESKCKITLMARSLDRLEEKCKNLSTAQAISVDVTDSGALVNAFKTARERFGPVNVLVNNAGAAASSPFHRITDDAWQQMLNVNLNGVFYCTREVTKEMREQSWGRIINIASVAGLAGAPYIAAYCAAKHGVIGLTRALALELAKTNVTVNAICPGYTNTELLDGAIDNILNKTSLTREEAIDQLKSTSPQHRFVEPEEVAATVAWLCQPGSESVTGQSIALAGGEVA